MLRENLGKIAAIFLVVVGAFYLIFLGTSAITADFGSTKAKVMPAVVSIAGGFVLLIGPMIVRRFPRGGPAVLAGVSLLVALLWPPMYPLLFPITLLVAMAAVYQGIEIRRNPTAAA